jgi:FKBP-type peptidyl-prolyl cis-trans isomerase FkpA/FKBP-type peptidyl-prolyl cis-trans isomerase FklB
MRVRTLWLAAVPVLAVGVAIPVFVSRAETKLGTEDEKTIYVLGYTLAGKLGPFQGLSGSDLDALVAGLRDGISSAKPQIDPMVYGPKISALAQARGAKLAEQDKQQAEQEKAASADFLSKAAAEKGATKTPSGLIIRVIKEGSGPSPTENDTVKVNYHGTLRDGSVFDSSIERGEPATFPTNRVIPCWTEALKTMKVGEKAHITCPADIAYGDHGMPPRIKPGAALAFDVELLDIVKTPAGAKSSTQ